MGWVILSVWMWGWCGRFGDCDDDEADCCVLYLQKMEDILKRALVLLRPAEKEAGFYFAGKGKKLEILRIFRSQNLGKKPAFAFLQSAFETMVMRLEHR